MSSGSARKATGNPRRSARSTRSGMGSAPRRRPSRTSWALFCPALTRKASVLIPIPASGLRSTPSQESSSPLYRRSGAGDDLADGDGEGYRAGGQVPDLHRCGGAGGGLAGVVALGEEAGDVSGPGQGGVQAAAGNGAQPGQPGGPGLPPGAGTG